MSDPVVLLQSFTPEAYGRSFRFHGFREEIRADHPAEVIPALARVEEAVGSGFHAAGFMTYEAAAGLDTGLATAAPGRVPLLWFGIFERREDHPSENIAGQSCSTSDWTDSETEDRYAKNVRRIRDYIASGDTYQVNYTFRRRFRLQGSPLDFYRELCRRQRASFCAYLEVGTWRIASASPELFFSLSGRKITVRPMKGTAKRGRWLEEDERKQRDLHESEKERAENLMIVDLLRNDLGVVSEPGSVLVGSLFDVETLDTVHQMTSTVTARLREEVSLPRLFTALFPCGSVTGAPKRRTTEIITELEDSPRGVYTGCIGFLSPDGEGVFSVAIRTAVIDSETGEGEMGIGSGVTWGSDAEAEYRECLAKSRFAIDRSPPFQLVETLRWEPEKGYTLLRRHLWRMATSARFFRFAYDTVAALHALGSATANLDRPAKVRLLLSVDGILQTEVTPLEEDPPHSVFAVELAGEPVDSQDIFLYHKTTHRPTYHDALSRRPDLADIIFVNERGEVTEGANHNVVIHLDGELLTPPRESGLLTGTFRGALIAAGVLREQVLFPDDLERAEGLFLINSVRGWRKAKLNMKMV